MQQGCKKSSYSELLNYTYLMKSFRPMFYDFIHGKHSQNDSNSTVQSISFAGTWKNVDD